MGGGRWVVPHVTPQQEVLSEGILRLVHSLKTGLVDVVRYTDALDHVGFRRGSVGRRTPVNQRAQFNSRPRS